MRRGLGQASASRNVANERVVEEGELRGAKDETVLGGQHHAAGALSGVRYRPAVCGAGRGRQRAGSIKCQAAGR